MHTRRLPLLSSALVALLTISCDRNPLASTRTTTPRDVRPATVNPEAAAAFGLPPAAPRATSALEDSLIERVVAMYPGVRGSDLRQSLLDPRAARVRVSNNPPAQAILDQIDAIRQLRLDSLRRAAVSRSVRDYPAAVVAVPALPTRDTTATAIIIRRARVEPHDVIELPEAHLTIGRYAAAVHALLASRRARGDSTVQNELIVVHGETVPVSWMRTGTDRIMAGEMEKLAASVPRMVPGVGRFKTIDAHLLGSKTP